MNETLLCLSHRGEDVKNILHEISEEILKFVWLNLITLTASVCKTAINILHYGLIWNHYHIFCALSCQVVKRSLHVLELNSLSILV